MYKSDAEIDGMYFEYAATPDRIALRREWGHRAGVAAHKRGTKRHENPFTPGPFMPMAPGWDEGWDESNEGVKVE